MTVMYQGSEAYSLDASERVRRRRAARPSFEVVEGRGLDAQVRRGISAKSKTRYKRFAVALAVVLAVAVVRLGLLAAAEATLANNSAMRNQITQADNERNELEIEHSVLSSSSRIDRIATQTYGMVAGDTAESMTAGSTASADDAGADGTATADDSAADDASATTDPDQPMGDTLDNVQTDAGDGSTAGSNAVDIDSLA